MTAPGAVYRLQFHPGFGFQDASAVVDYLADLGLTHMYASPIFKSRPQSAHGYDVVDHGRINPELGSVEDFDGLAAKLRGRSMGWLQDVVPNHMAFHKENPALMDVLEHGPASAYHRFFDVDWDHPFESMNGRLLAPFLGAFFGRTLENGELKLAFGPNGFRIDYYDLSFPIRPESYPDILTPGLDELQNGLDEDNPDLINLLGVLYVVKNLAGPGDSGERAGQTRFIKGALWRSYQNNPRIRAFVDRSIEIINGRSGRPDSFNLLESVLLDQHYRLSFWKVATEEVNYRRFFNINELICLRQEDPDVFDRTHRLILELVDRGVFSGLRIDHIDGFYDPEGYLRRLRDRIGDAYLVVEKILEESEELPADWPVDGTTGYDFMARMGALLCDPGGRRPLTRVYSEFTGRRFDFGQLTAEKKRLIIGKEMAGEVENMARHMKNLSARDRFAGDVTMYGLKRALVEVLAQFPVYRTYIRRAEVSAADREVIRTALDSARRSGPGLANELDFIRRFLLLEFEDYHTEEVQNEWVHFVMKFQQVTGPLMAKGFEDTTLYVYNRLVSQNEVGGAPERMSLTPEAFHRFCVRRNKTRPHTMNASSTHDAKRGEDVRARLHVLSELPLEWEARVKKWTAANKGFKKRLAGRPAPDRNDEYLFYQTLLGAWPFDSNEWPGFDQRIIDYMIKAVREAKVHTEWIKPDEGYEAAFSDFCREVLHSDDFLDDFRPFQRKVAHYGVINSLTQTALKILAPGVPDFYQGAELWDLNLVDPDNRRPVDFARRRAALDQIQNGFQNDPLDLIDRLLADPSDGRVKLLVVHRLLGLRSAWPDVFDGGDYVGLKMEGSRRRHAAALVRRGGRRWVAALVPRLAAKLCPPGRFPLGPDAWGDTRAVLPAGAPSRWTDLFTGQTLTTGPNLVPADALAHFPAAVLYSEVSSS